MALVEQHVVELAGHEHLLVGGRRHALGRGDEPGAHVGEVAAEDLRREAAPARPRRRRRARRGRRTSERTARGEREPVGPAGLPAGTGREQHEPVGAGLDGPPGVVDRRDVGEHEAPRVVQRGDDRRRRADARDDDLDAVGADALDVGGRVGVAHDDVRAVRRVRGPRGRRRSGRATRRARRASGSWPSGTHRWRPPGRRPARDPARTPGTSARRRAAVAARDVIEAGGPAPGEVGEHPAGSAAGRCTASMQLVGPDRVELGEVRVVGLDAQLDARRASRCGRRRRRTADRPTGWRGPC